LDFTVKPLSDIMASEIDGIDLGRPLDAETVSALNDIFLERSVLCFRGQKLDHAAYLAAARQFGKPKPHLYRAYRVDGFPEISVVSNADKDTHGSGKTYNRAAHFHSDEIYKEVPCKATMLYGVEIPEEGGETRFINMRLAYETLPEAVKARIDGLKGLFRHQHSIFTRVKDDPELTLPKLTSEEAAEVPDVIHPIVRTHPENGTKALFITNTRTEHIVDMPRAESDALLQTLYDHLYDESFQYHHRWRPGDVLMWDNRCLLHAATPNVPAGQKRLLYRTILEGTRPV
jgi:taurine dioxygenase